MNTVDNTSEIEITPEMIQAVKHIIESREAFISFDEVLGVEILEEDAKKIVRATILACGRPAKSD